MVHSWCQCKHTLLSKQTSYQIVSSAFKILQIVVNKTFEEHWLFCGKTHLCTNKAACVNFWNVFGIINIYWRIYSSILKLWFEAILWVDLIRIWWKLFSFNKINVHIWMFKNSDSQNTSQSVHTGKQTFGEIGRIDIADKTNVWFSWNFGHFTGHF